MAKFTHKRGDTFSVNMVISDGDTPVDLTSYTVASKIRQNDTGQTLVQAMTVTKTDAANGEINVAATATNAAGWATGIHKMDVEFTLSGVVTSTETFDVEVVPDITFT